MNELLDELDRVAEAGFCYVALSMALAIPDMCAALDSQNGETTRRKYIAWFDQWVSPKYTVGPDKRPSLSGETCYYYRCGMLHQGRAMHEKLGYSRILFIEPGRGLTMHNNVLNDALNIDVPMFVRSITSSARAWIQSKKGDGAFEQNLQYFMRRHKGGLPPYIVGVDVIS